jgi:putative copper export protein
MTGVAAAWLHLGTLPALWQSAYGRTLLIKLAVLTLVVATGAYNWRVVRPFLNRNGNTAISRLHRSATLEIIIGAVVIAITAILVATPTPN